MRNRTFHNNKHADDYLKGSIIRVGEKPVVVDGVLKWEMYYHSLQDKGHNDKLPVDHPSIDMNPVPLGFLASKLETDFRSVYCKRNPYRQWKIGLTAYNCIVSNPCKTITGYSLSPHHVLYTRMMEDTILGRYLDPKSAQELSLKYEGAAAFGRRFAVFKDYLLFKDLGEPVGTVTKGKPELHDDFTYLTTMLNEDLNASGNC